MPWVLIWCLKLWSFSWCWSAKLLLFTWFAKRCIEKVTHQTENNVFFWWWFGHHDVLWNHARLSHQPNIASWLTGCVVQTWIRQVTCSVDDHEFGCDVSLSLITHQGLNSSVCATDLQLCWHTWQTSSCYKRPSRCDQTSFDNKKCHESWFDA